MRRKGATTHSGGGGSHTEGRAGGTPALRKTKIRLAIWTRLHLHRENTRERECDFLNQFSFVEKAECDPTREEKFIKEHFNGIL